MSKCLLNQKGSIEHAKGSKCVWDHMEMNGQQLILPSGCFIVQESMALIFKDSTEGLGFDFTWNGGARRVSLRLKGTELPRATRIVTEKVPKFDETYEVGL